jgi:hypothetical protein
LIKLFFYRVRADAVFFYFRRHRTRRLRALPQRLGALLDRQLDGNGESTPSDLFSAARRKRCKEKNSSRI